MLYEERDEKFYDILSECHKQKEYKNRDDWVGNVIHRELCKGLDFLPY